MKKALIGAAALALMLPHAAMAAQDGPPGATSTGSFDVTLTVQPPVTDQVQVVGLDDVSFGSVGLSTGQTIVAQQQDFFCLNRTIPGDVLVTFEQMSDPPADASFRMSKDAVSHLPFYIKMYDINGQETAVERGVQFPSPRSMDFCTAATAGPVVGHRIAVTPAPIPTGTPNGLYSTTIQITIAPAG